MLIGAEEGVDDVWPPHDSARARDLSARVRCASSVAWRTVSGRSASTSPRPRNTAPEPWGTFPTCPAEARWKVPHSRVREAQRVNRGWGVTTAADEVDAHLLRLAPSAPHRGPVPSRPLVTLCPPASGTDQDVAPAYCFVRTLSGLAVLTVSRCGVRLTQVRTDEADHRVAACRCQRQSEGLAARSRARCRWFSADRASRNAQGSPHRVAAASGRDSGTPQQCHHRSPMTCRPPRHNRWIARCRLGEPLH